MALLLASTALTCAWALPASYRTDITYIVEATDNLSTWTALARSVNGAPFAAENGGVVVQDSVSGNTAADIIGDDPANTSNKRFMRLRVTAD